MDELNYMKQLVREYLDLTLYVSLNSLPAKEYTTCAERISTLEEELKELSGYED